LGLAIFYLDVGSLIDTKFVHISSKRFRHLSDCKFFDYILKSFKKHGLTGKRLNNGYCLELNEQSSWKFSELIKEYVVPELQYKLFPEHRNCYNAKLFEEKEVEIKREKIYVNVLKTTPMMKKESKVLLKYDIETSNHNYMVGSCRDFSGVVVHNSNPEGRTGGVALPFYDTITFRVSKVWKSEERDERGKIVAHQAKIKFDKNKAGGLPADPIVIRICYDGRGIDQDGELMSVAEINGLIKEFKRGRYNFAKIGTDELLDENIEFFKKDEFREVLNKHPEMKEMILKFIREGKFYTEADKIVEDNPDISEAETIIEEKKEKDASASDVKPEVTEETRTKRKKLS
jgi:hypothetical protein